MARIARVRVSLRSKSHNPSADEKSRSFKSMFTAFKRQCSDAGIQHLYKKYEFYEKPSEKRNKKNRELKLVRDKAKRSSNPRSNKRK